MQVFVREPFTMIAAPVQCDVDGVPKGSHFATVPPMGYRTQPPLPMVPVRAHHLGRITDRRSVYLLRACSPARDEVSHRATPVRKSKLETGFDEPRRHDSAALEDELGFGTQEEG